MIHAANKYKTPVGVLFAVGLVESGKGGALHPFAVNIEGVSHYPGSGTEALAIVRQAQKAGIKLIDVGCMQINVHYHGARFASLAEMFDPSRNVTYGAAYLSALHARAGNWTEAVARYHASSARPAAQAAYVCAVVQRLVAANLGAWTASARYMCSEQRYK